MANVNDLYRSFQSTGGGSYNPTNGNMNPETGYMVSIPGFERIVKKPSNGNVFRSQFTNYFHSEGIDSTLKADPNLYVGVWTHNGNMYLDVSEHFDDFSEAYSHGIRRNQIAIYDCENKQDIKINKEHIYRRDPDLVIDKKY